MNLKEKLLSLLIEKAEDTNNYFASDFWDEYPNEDEDILDFLAEKFFDIDMLWTDNKDIEKPVRKTLNDAIQMIERKHEGKSFISVKINFDDYNKVERLFPDIFPNIPFFIKEADHNLKKLGLCEYVPCIVMFALDNDEFEDMLNELIDIETNAFNTKNGEHPKDDDPLYQKYLKYGCLYEILYNAERMQ